MKMTWWNFDDHQRRVEPFLRKLATGGKILPADLEALSNPLLIPKI